MDFFRALEERPTTHTSQQSYVLSLKPTGTKVKSITREHAAAAAKAKLNKNKVSIEMAQPITVKRRKLVMQLREQPPPAQGPASQPSIPSPRDLTLHPHFPRVAALGLHLPWKAPAEATCLLQPALHSTCAVTGSYRPRTDKISICIMLKSKFPNKARHHVYLA